MLRASVAVEAVGIPTVSLVCEGFVGQALATGRGLGFDAMRLAVLRGHVDAQSSEEMVAALVAHTIDEIVVGLTQPDQRGVASATEPAALDVVARGSLAEVNDLFVARGWSEGLPVVPPTRAVIEAFLAPSGHDPWRVIGTARPSGREMTVWSIAVNAVMAGCRPEHLPVVLAVAEVLASDEYGVEHSGNTTGADAQIIVSGPSIAALGFNHGQGAMREGALANTAVARWLRLYLRNVCGFTADEHDKATFGNATKVVLAEDVAALAEIGWPTLAEDNGIEAGRDAVTAVRINSSAIVGSVFGSRPDEIVPYLADGLARIAGWDLTHVYGLGHGHYSPLLVVSPMIARTFGRAGWSKDDLRQALFVHARVPAGRFEKLIGEWSNLTAGRRRLTDLVAEGLLPTVFAESDDPERLVPIVTDRAKFQIAVAGDANRANAFVMSNDGLHGWWTSRAIDVTRSTDLVCEVPPRPSR